MSDYDKKIYPQWVVWECNDIIRTLWPETDNPAHYYAVKAFAELATRLMFTDLHEKYGLKDSND